MARFIKSITIILIIQFSCSVFAQSNLILPQPHSQLGDTEYLYLNSPGFWVQPFNNDFLGETDKYLTNSTGLSYAWLTDSMGYDIGFFRRLYTPALSPNFSSPKFASPPGVLADDSEFRFSFSKNFQGFYFFPEISFHVIGHQGAHKIYNFVHQTIGSPLNYDQYGPETAGNYISGGLKIVKVANYYWLGLGYYNSPYITEIYEEVGIKYTVENFGLAGQIKKIQQLDSTLYKQITPTRTEAQIAVYYAWYSFNVNYNSSFLSADSIPQWYIAPINLKFDY